MRSGFVPRARARRSVSSWSGVALPMSAATGAGRAGDSGTTSRPIGVSAGSIASLAPAARMAPDAEPDDARRPGAPVGRGRCARAGRSRSVRTRTSPVVRARRGQVPVQERLEVAIGGRQPRGLFDLEDELAAGRRSAPGRDDEQVVGVGEAGGDRLGGGRCRCAPSARRRSDGSRIDGPARQVRADGARGEDRAQVADRVAPALVELAGLDRDPGEGPGRRPAGSR